MTSYPNSLSITLSRGETASFEEMQAYGSVLQSFICCQETQLEETKDVRRYNDTIDYLQSLANGYNEQLCVYKQMEASRQQKLMTALMVLTT